MSSQSADESMAASKALARISSGTPTLKRTKRLPPQSQAEEENQVMEEASDDTEPEGDQPISLATEAIAEATSAAAQLRHSPNTELRLIGVILDAMLLMFLTMGEDGTDSVNAE